MAAKVPVLSTLEFTTNHAPIVQEPTTCMGLYFLSQDLQSPEGVVDASKGSICLTAAGLFRKTTVSGNTGWVLL